jgi:hypothetical protein
MLAVACGFAYGHFGTLLGILDYFHRKQDPQAKLIGTVISRSLLRIPHDF